MSRTAVKSTCLLCGCGCKLGYLLGQNGVITGCQIVAGSPKTGYESCFKGMVAWKSIYRNRIKKPYERRENGELKELSWSQVIDKLASLLRDYREDEIAFEASGEIANEDNYVIQKFARTVNWTNNIDTCARLCHASTLLAFEKTLGITVMPDKMNDVLNADLIFIIGSNPYSNYPALSVKMIIAKRKGANRISVQTASNETSRKLADVRVAREPGSEFIFISTLVAELIRRGYVDESTCSKIEGWKAFKKHHLDNYYVPMVTRLCQVDPEIFDEIVKLVGESKSLVITHGMGITQSGIGTDTIIALVDLALIKNAKLVSMRGKINIQGAGDVGCSPNHYPTGRISKKTRKEYEQLIGLQVPASPGKTVIDFLIRKPVDLVYICGTNPAVSMPYLEETHKVLKRSIIIYHHPFWTKTTEFADIILPLPTLIETEGTITNAEGLVRKVEKVTTVVKSALRPMHLFSKIAKKIGLKGFNYSDPLNVFGEICKVQPRYRHIDIDQLWFKDVDAYVDKKPRFRKLLIASPPAKYIRRSIEYPFILRTARSPYHFCAGDVTRNVEELMKREPENLLYMNPHDMISLGLQDNDKARVTSITGSLIFKVKSNPHVPSGILITRFHFEDSLVNKLTPLELDEESRTPSYK
ncbi:MAG: hypothetical protein DRJ47_10840, partial [Thermoprotei archaeon]